MTQITFHPQFSVRCKSLSKLALAWRNKTRKKGTMIQIHVLSYSILRRQFGFMQVFLYSSMLILYALEML